MLRVRARLGRVGTSPRCDKGGVVEDIKMLHYALAMYTAVSYTHLTLPTKRIV